MNARELIVPDRAREVAARETTMTPAAIFQIAIDKNFDLERINGMMDIAKRWQDMEAERAFNEAMAAFKKNPPQVFADKINKQYDSQYASLGNFVNTVNSALGEFGLEASWEIDQTDKIKVTCLLAHSRGHKRRVTLMAPPDTSGAKNPIQQIKSTVTYLELATFQAVTGIAVQGAAADDDGNSSGKPAEYITESQVADLETLLTETASDKARFLKYLKVERLEDILAASYSAVVKMVEAKRRGAK